MFDKLKEDAKVVIDEFKAHPKESAVFVAKVTLLTVVIGVATVGVIAIAANEVVGVTDIFHRNEAV